MQSNNIVLSTDVMRASDNYTINNLGISGIELMHRAGRKLYKNIPSEYFNCGIDIYCGKGNNGGDGLLLALLLKEKNIGFRVFVDKAEGEEAQYYYNKLIQYDNINIYELFEKAEDTESRLAIDCVFGTGFKGNLDEKYKNVIDNINRYGYILSCDIPSGLNGNNGLASEPCVKADRTVSIGFYKSGHFLNDGIDCCGELINEDIGIELHGKEYLLADDALIKECYPERKRNSNKGTYGTVGIVACSSQYVGAGVLSSTAAVNAMGEVGLINGAGLCKLCVPEILFPYMWERITHATLLSQKDYMSINADAVAIGMGIGTDSDKSIMLDYILNQNSPLVIDADALRLISQNTEILKEKKCVAVLTPHPKEFSLLTGKSVKEILENPIITAEKFAEEYKVILLLKGASTIITDGLNTYIVNKGSSSMAKGGSGDVLSGVITALLARKIPALKAAACGAYICGLAGELAADKTSEYTAMAMDTATAVKEVLELKLKNKNNAQ